MEKDRVSRIRGAVLIELSYKALVRIRANFFAAVSGGLWRRPNRCDLFKPPRVSEGWGLTVN